MIGTFGEIVFIASSEKIRTFDEFVRSSTSRWTKHDIHLQKPKSEFIGPDIDQISFTMRFDVKYGMNPRKEMDQLLVMCREGKVETLIIGGKGLGVNKWYIDAVSQTWEQVDGKGNVLVGTVEVTMKEYV